jgi:hypothetical protein
MYSQTVLDLHAASLILAAGPFIDYHRSYGWSSIDYLSSYDSTTVRGSSSSYSWTYGVMGIIGLRAFLTPDISLHAEYELTYGWESRRVSNSNFDSRFGDISTSSGLADSDATNFNLSNIRIGLIFVL